LAAAFLISLVQPVYAQQMHSTTNNEPIVNANVEKVLSSNASTIIKTNYNPVPENARGPTIPEKGYIVEALGGWTIFK
jgi:hypothetical protein